LAAIDAAGSLADSEAILVVDAGHLIDLVEDAELLLEAGLVGAARTRWQTWAAYQLSARYPRVTPT